ncbi:5741_t:CDS:2, partial [Scutellospora calospora]
DHGSQPTLVLPQSDATRSRQHAWNAARQIQLDRVAQLSNGNSGERREPDCTAESSNSDTFTRLRSHEHEEGRVADEDGCDVDRELDLPWKTRDTGSANLSVLIANCGFGPAAELPESFSDRGGACSRGLPRIMSSKRSCIMRCRLRSGRVSCHAGAFEKPPGSSAALMETITRQTTCTNAAM